MSRFSSRLGASVALACLAIGCAPSLKENPPRDPEVSAPDSFGLPEDKSSSAERTGEIAAKKKWQEFFAEPELRSLIETALENNRELKVLLQEIIIENSEFTARKGEYMPKVNAEAGVGVEKVGRETSQGRSDEATGVPEHLPNYTFGLSASWEVDIWNKLRSASKAAKLRYLASIEGRKFIITELVAEIARSFYELMALDNRLEVLEHNIALQHDALEIVKVQKEAAQVTELAVQRFEAEVLKNKSRRFDLEQKRMEAENRINFLLGRFPQPIKRNSERFKAEFETDVVSGVPSELLENRPDVKQAELELEAAKLDVKSARAEFYPALSIDARVGYETFNARHLVLTPESMLYNLGGNLSAPLLNRSAIKAHYRSANARQLKAVYKYEQAILVAVIDVQNQLNKIENLKQSFDLEKRQVQKLTESIEVSNILFQSARADYMEVLLTRRDSLEAEMELIETKLQQMEAKVTVYQALGGGWR